MLHLSGALRALLPSMPCVLGALLPYVSRLLHAFVSHMPRALGVVVPHMSRVLRPLCLECPRALCALFSLSTPSSIYLSYSMC